MNTFVGLLAGLQICRATFLMLHGIVKRRYANLKAHFRAKGLSPRTHGNRRRLLHNAFSPDTVNGVVRFIDNLLENMPLHYLVGFLDLNVLTKILPSSETKTSVFRLYEQSAKIAGSHAVGHSKFLQLWNDLVPRVVISEPMTDLCHTCQKNNVKIYRAVNIPDSEKSKLLKEMETHLLNAERERSLYKDACESTKKCFNSNLENFDFTQV